MPTNRPSDIPPMADPEAGLEAELIAEFLRSRGLTGDLHLLDDAHRKQVLEQASAYATGRLAEISARAHYVQDLHRHE